MISFIMPAKNESLYINEAINGLRESDEEGWELIIVNDHSDDNTFEIAQNIANKDKRVKVFQNRDYGKVAALSYGYEVSRNSIIKCIDADDILDNSFFVHSSLSGFDAMCHDFLVVKENQEKIGLYILNKKIIQSSFYECFKNLISIPRSSWSFTREIGDKIFPLPKDLPFEDVWFSLVIKRFAQAIKYVPENLYFYRQNNNQTYGGILNFSDDIIKFRAKRMLKLIKVLENEAERRFNYSIETDFFREIFEYYALLSKDDLGYTEVLNKNISKQLKAKIFLLKKAGFVAPFLLRLKWMIERSLRFR